MYVCDLADNKIDLPTSHFEIHSIFFYLKKKQKVIAIFIIQS